MRRSEDLTKFPVASPPSVTAKSFTSAITSAATNWATGNGASSTGVTPGRTLAAQP